MKAFSAAVLAASVSALYIPDKYENPTMEMTGSTATGISSVSRTFSSKTKNDANNYWITFDYSTKVTMSAALASGDEAESLVCVHLEPRTYNCIVSKVAATTTYTISQVVFSYVEDKPIPLSKFPADTSFLAATSALPSFMTKGKECTSPATAFGTATTDCGFTTDTMRQYTYSSTGNKVDTGKTTFDAAISYSVQQRDKNWADYALANIKTGLGKVIEGSYAKVSGTSKSVVSNKAWVEKATASSAGALSTVASVGAAIAALAIAF